MSERLGIIIFGATGFTGKFVVKNLYHLAKKNNISWGVAGRNLDKLKLLLSELSSKTGYDITNVRKILADANDEESLKQMTVQARLLVNCCGPYRFYGESVVKACLSTYTHHIDISGEPQYMENIQLQYNKEAQEKGIYIISACGFDCIPTDLGLVYLQQKFDGIVNSVETYLNTERKIKSDSPDVTYTTWECAVYGLAHADELRALRSKLFSKPLPDLKPKLTPRPLFSKAEDVENKWILPFPGADRSVVKRSQRHFYETTQKRPAQVEIYTTAESISSVFGTISFGLIFSFLSKFEFGRKLLLKYPEFFSFGRITKDGPTEQCMESTNYTVTLVGKGWSKDNIPSAETSQISEPPNKTMIVRISGVDPSYGTTSIIVNLCAMTVLMETDKLPESGGVFTPGAAFANTSLIQKLQQYGMKFEVLSAKL